MLSAAQNHIVALLYARPTGDTINALGRTAPGRSQAESSVNWNRVQIGILSVTIWLQLGSLSSRLYSDWNYSIESSLLCGIL